MRIPTYIINLKSRSERRGNVLKEFESRSEFDVTLVEAIAHEVGLIGLWKSIKHILKNLISVHYEYVIICQDDHQFTEQYSFELLKESIDEAIALDADILLGGVSWFQTVFQSSRHLYWVEKFSGLQFSVVFKKFFAPLLTLELDGFDAGDYRISAFTDKKWVIYPYISTQRDYGYSDVTVKNNKPIRQQQLFEQSDSTMKTMIQIASYFTNHPLSNLTLPINFDVTIPTFIINNPEQKNRIAHITKQFSGREEFQISMVEAVKKKDFSIDKWETIKRIVIDAIKDNEDVIIICEDCHEFTKNYSKSDFISAIVHSSQSGADILLGGITGDLAHILPISDQLCWVNSFSGCSFIVIHKKVFSLILNEPYDKIITTEEMLSRIAPNKQVFYPFISGRKKFKDREGVTLYKTQRDEKLFLLQLEYRFERVKRNHTLFSS